MTKKHSKKETGNRKKAQKQKPKPISILPGIIIFAYILIPTYTPNLLAFDTNAPKFLALALVNLAAFLLLLFHKPLQQQFGSFANFFKTGLGLVYAAFLLVSLLSFVNAVNPLESLLHWIKLFTVFSAVFILSMVIGQEMRYLRWIVILVTFMLIIDSIAVLYYIKDYIQGDISRIGDIKFIYSNKNILSSAIFVKLPMAIWLMVYEKRWLKWLGWIGLLVGIIAVFFMATRAFYLGLIMISTLFLAYLIINFVRTRAKTKLVIGASFLVAVAIAYLAFTGVQQYLFPERSKRGRNLQGIVQRLATISTFDASASARIDAWKWSWQLLKEKPLLGVGSGNWKIQILKYENKVKEDYSYLYKAHNDFIETFAETGFLGGLLYLGIFALMAWAFLKRLFRNDEKEDPMFRLYFLGFAGILFYSVDAFFNFPIDRPEIQVLFTLYLATAISVIHLSNSIPNTQNKNIYSWNPNKWQGRSLITIAVLVLVGASYFLHLNFESSKTQRIVHEEVKSGTLRSPSEKIIAGFPLIPNLNSNGESIAVQKARYFLSEEKFNEAIALLRNDRATPWDGRREYFMGMGFQRLGMTDSAVVYAEKLHSMKPNHGKNTMVLCQMLEERQEYEKVAGYLDFYLEKNKKYDRAWVYASQFYYRRGEVDKAWEIIQEGKIYLPGNTTVEEQHNYLYQLIYVEPYQQEYYTARDFYDKKEYNNALLHVSKYIEEVPDDFIARRLRTYIYYFLNEYQKCIEEANYTITLSDDVAIIINLRGICYREFNNLDAACRDFQTAMQMGDASGKTNYERYCANQ